MEQLRSFVVALFLLSFTSSVVLSQDPQADFITLNCGGENYTDDVTGLRYISDATFIGDNNNAVNNSVSPKFKNDLSIARQLKTLTSFPKGIRNCYTLRPAQGKLNKYLIRVTFFHGNYDGNADNQLQQFDLHLGVEYWETVVFNPKNSAAYVDKEIIHTPSSDLVHVCLVNTGLGTPFISTLELRPLIISMYPTAFGGSLMFNMRYNFGTTVPRFLRYKDDVFDRIWVPEATLPGTTPVNTTSTVNVTKNDILFMVPSGVMNTALVPSDPTQPLRFTLYPTTLDDKLYIYMSFAEIQERQPNQTREFNIYLNGEFYSGPIVPSYLKITTLYNTVPYTNRIQYIFSLNKTQNSTLPPIFNALEVYYLKEFNEPQTDDNDVAAMFGIKSDYGVSKNWGGDPCSPASYSWDGLKCNYDPGFNPPRITSMNLSASGLTGSISAYISYLTMIQVLDLSNNKLTGPIPDFLFQLSFLSVLNLSGNNFSGPVPEKLLQKFKEGTLILSIESVGSNTNTCQDGSCNKNKKNFVAPVVASVASVLLLVLAIVGILLVIKWRKQRAPEPVGVESKKYDDLPIKNRRYTFAEIKDMTNNFERILGKGGFGTVYHGRIGRTQVAVKILSSTSGQGFKEFQSEVL